MDKTKSNGMDTDSMQMSFETGRFSHSLSCLVRINKYVYTYLHAWVYS